VYPVPRFSMIVTIIRYIQSSVGNKIWSIFETKGLHNVSR